MSLMAPFALSAAPFTCSRSISLLQRRCCIRRGSNGPKGPLFLTELSEFTPAKGAPTRFAYLGPSRAGPDAPCANTAYTSFHMSFVSVWGACLSALVRLCRKRTARHSTRLGQKPGHVYRSFSKWGKHSSVRYHRSAATCPMHRLMFRASRREFARQN